MINSIISSDERDKLYKEIWTEPVSIVAARYGISDVALRKRCKKYNIPLPPLGYWSRVRSGQKVKVPALPPVSGEFKKVIKNYAIKYRDDINELSEEQLDPSEELLLLSEETKKYIKEKCSEIKVKSQLRDPSPLITNHREEIAYRRKRDKELKAADFNWAYYTSVKSKYRDNKGVLAIFVTEGQINRAYRITNTIIKAIEEMEGSITVEGYRAEDNTRVRILDTYMSFKIVEETKKVPLTEEKRASSKRKYEDKPTGILSFTFEDIHNPWHKFGSIIEFKDTKECPIETQVGKIIYDLFVVANKCEVLGMISEKRYEKQREEERRIKHLREVRENEVKRVELLNALVNDWDKAQKIRNFVTDVEKKMFEFSETDNKELTEWIKWAHSIADWIDPLTTSDNSLLEKPGNNIFGFLDKFKV